MAALHECPHVSHNFEKILLLIILLFLFLKNNANCHYLVEPILSFPGQCLLQAATHCNKFPLSLIVKYVVFMKVSHFQSALASSSIFWCLSHLLRFYVLLFIRYLILSCDILLSLHLYIQGTRNILLFSCYLDD